MDNIQNGHLQYWRLTQKTRKESHKSVKVCRHIPLVILKHPRRGAQKHLKQEVSYGQNSKWTSTVLAIDSKDS